MKKFFVLVFVVISIVSACALAEETERRGAFEFEDLFMQRLTQQKDKDGNDSLTYIYASTPHILPDDAIIISSSAGMMEIRMSDFTVSMMSLTIMDMAESDDETDNSIMICAAAISALEYDYITGGAFETYGELIPGTSTSAYDAGAKILNQKIYPQITSEVIDDLIAQDTRILVYSGNYDYYLGSFVYESDGVDRVLLKLYAVARE